MNVESVTSHNKVKALRHLYDTLESNVRSLKALGVPPDSYRSLLSSVLMNKLPGELQLIISRKVGDDDRNLEVILKEFVQELEAREQTSASSATPCFLTKRPMKDFHTAATLLSSSLNLSPSASLQPTALNGYM